MTCLIAHGAPDRRFLAPGCGIPFRCLSDRGLSDITFGIYSEYISHSNPEILGVFAEIKRKLPNWKEVVLEELYLSKIAHFNTILAETANESQIWKAQHRTLAPQTNIVYSVCSRSSLRQYMMSAAQKTRAINIFKAVFSKVDLVITPTTACLPKEIDPASLTYGELDETNLLWTMWFVYLANLCGLPSMTVNAGYSASGLPVGVMITGPWWSEELVLSAARGLETQLAKPARFYCPL